MPRKISHSRSGGWCKMSSAPRNGTTILLYGTIEGLPDGVKLRGPVIVAGFASNARSLFRVAGLPTAKMRIRALAWKPISGKPNRSMASAPRDGSAVLLLGSPYMAGKQPSSEKLVLSAYYDGVDGAFCATAASWIGPFIEAIAWLPIGPKPKAAYAELILADAPRP